MKANNQKWTFSVSQSANIFVQHKTKQKTIQTWTLSGPDVCLEDPRRLCKEKLLLFLIEAFEHPLKPETKFEYLQFLNICNVWTYAIFEYLPLWIFVIIKSILYFYKYIFKCLLNLTELKIIEIVVYWEKFCPLISSLLPIVPALTPTHAFTTKSPKSVSLDLGCRGTQENTVFVFK